MASFDLETFMKVKGQTGTGTLEALGMSFGVPSCMLNLAKTALALLPSSVLTDIQSKLFGGQSKAKEKLAEVNNKLSEKSGIWKVMTTRGGFWEFVSDTSWMGIDNDGKQSKDNLGGFLDAVDYAVSVGADIYQNIQDAAAYIEGIKDCLDKFNNVSKFQAGNSADEAGTLDASEQAELINSVYAADIAKMAQAQAFVNAAGSKIKDINSILADRAADPSLEPRLLDSSELDPFLDKTNFKRFGFEDPGIEDEEVFRLSYGPPISTDGQYILTSDGLYYDSRTGGLQPALTAISGIIPIGEQWTYDYDPNLGGKGQAVSLDSLNKFKDNLFDPSRIDDSQGMQVYYDEDHFLSVLKQQRDKLVYDLSSDLVELINDASYGEGSSVVKNQRNLIISEIANHNNKLNRRKKQIEIAVKAPQIYQDATSPIFAPGKVPINDFAYLADMNLEVDLEKQNALIFNQADVVGIVLPIVPRFTTTPAKPPSLRQDHLLVPTVGKGSIIYTPSSTQAGTVLSLTDQIISKDLFAIYNFLETDVVLPSSVNFQVTNCATEDMYNNAQLVAASNREVFVSGLGIPFLEGIVKNKSSSPTTASAMGSFVKLPDTSQFRDLTYSSTGFTLECWAHVPGIMDGDIGWLSSTTSSLTKVLLGCENVGAQSGVSAVDHTGAERDLDYLRNDRGENFTRGLLCGFTRDTRITGSYGLSSGYSTANYENDPVSSLSFFIAPTQARDLSSASWINNDECEDFPSFYKMKVDLSSNSGAFGQVSSSFVLLDITCDPTKDEIKMYADGSLIATSSVSTVFGVEATQPPGLPSFRKENSFEYSTSTVDGPNSIKYGPLLNTFYTPWIVGGGYTDGMYLDGNFMGGGTDSTGGSRSGIVSGLRGHVGSLKFYSRPLNTSEVETNYKAQKGFFKNIQTY